MRVWDSAALARCSSPCKREVVADPQARSGQAVRFTGSAEPSACTTRSGSHQAGAGSPSGCVWKKGGHFATEFEAGGRASEPRADVSVPILLADGSFTERIVELNLPGPLNVVSWRGGLPKDLIVDRITVEPSPTPLQWKWPCQRIRLRPETGGCFLAGPHFHQHLNIRPRARYHDAERFCAWLTRHEADQGTTG